jgi:hypothetical protein
MDDSTGFAHPCRSDIYSGRLGVASSLAEAQQLKNYHKQVRGRLPFRRAKPF